MEDQYPPCAINQIGWLDFETKSETDLTQAGAYRYATEADAVVLAWSIGDDPKTTVTAVRRFGKPLQWSDMPQAFRDHHELVRAGRACWAAYNAGFDRAVWNYATSDFPILRPQMIIDVMAQATAAGLPPDLFKAAKICGGAAKDPEGKELLKLFCLPNAEGTPQTHPEAWQRLLSYAHDDIEAMRSVYRHTLPLTMAEWREYWAMEEINERGVLVDVNMAKTAALLAHVDRRSANDELYKLTDGTVNSVDAVQAIVCWVMGNVPLEAQAIMTKREEEIDENGTVTKPAKLALTRRRVQLLLAFCRNYIDHPNIQRAYQQQLQRVERVLQIRLYGGSKTPQKYAKMVGQQIDGVLYGQYVFNGAGQTGRASSRGVQVHNLARDVLPYEHEAIEALLAQPPQPVVNKAVEREYAAFAKIGDDTPVSRKLSLLIRPTFIAGDDNTFVWSDWSQIEARVLPWLAGDSSRGAVQRLDIFREVDADPSKPDLYTRTAAQLSHVLIDQVTKAMRQRGKVAELALGFMGGVGALQNMAAGYGLHLDNKEAKTIVDGWRAANSWAVEFSRELWEAAIKAKNNPGVVYRAGRIHFAMRSDYFHGTLLMSLPSGRVLTYRNMRWQNIDVLDDDDKPTGEKKLEMMYGRGYGRSKLWPGILIENATQACAADILRGTLVRCEDEMMRVRLHTHDEIVCECHEEDADQVEETLREIMRRGFDWSEGLPIMSDETISPYYTKQEL